MEKHKTGVPRIQFHFLSPVTLPNRRLLKDFLIELFRKQRIKVKSLQIVFCSDSYLLKLNQIHLKHDAYTDIITFNLAEIKEPIEGEIYISTKRVRVNASTFETSSIEELHRVIFHGILHLLGWKDKTKSEKHHIRKAELRLIRKYFKLVSRET